MGDTDMFEEGKGACGFDGYLKNERCYVNRQYKDGASPALTY